MDENNQAYKTLTEDSNNIINDNSPINDSVEFTNDVVKDNDELYNLIDTKPKSIFFFISEIGFLLLLSIPIFIFFFIPQYHSQVQITSKNITNFLYNSPPKILFHLSDIHVSHNVLLRQTGSFIFLLSFIKYKPDLILLTGDLVDNYEGDINWRRVGSPQKVDWDSYNVSVRNIIHDYPVIDIAGNHDVWGVDDVLSEKNLFLDYSFSFNRNNVKNEDEFIIKKYKMLDMCFILFNDFSFPTPHPPYGTVANTDKRRLDLLENMIDQSANENCNILTHFPVDRPILIKSSKGHTFSEIISKKNINCVFTGHWHTKNLKIIHHGAEGGLEYNAPSVFDKKKGGFITVDNDNLVYHETYIPNYGVPPSCFLTYPVPKEQLSSHHVFNLNKMEIRVLFFNFKNWTDIKLTIDGDIKGELKQNLTLRNGALLFSYPVNLKNGEYKIVISGPDCNIYTEFIVGDSYKTEKEEYSNSVLGQLILFFSSILLVILLFVIIFPCGGNCKCIKNMEDYISGVTITKIPSVVFGFLLLFLGPLILRERYLNLNTCCKVFIFIFAIYPLIFPVVICNTVNGLFSFSFNAFIFIWKDNIRYDPFSLCLTYAYYMFIIYPNVIYLTGMEYYSKNLKINKTIHMINLIGSNILMLFILFLIIYIVQLSTSSQYLILTPGYIIVWILLKIIVHRFSYADVGNRNLLK